MTRFNEVGYCVPSNGLFIALTSLNITLLDRLSSRHNKQYYPGVWLFSSARLDGRVWGYKWRDAHEDSTLILQT